MPRLPVPLYDEYRLVERSEREINGAWKGAHLLLFFLAFVFGSFCTFCFHMLMYLFDEKCVLFPKLLSLTSLRHNVIYEFIPTSKDLGDMPVDFLSTQWVEKSTCALPTYVPLVSGIFGLVWTTMFLMCSSGSRTLTGLQRPWRVLPPVFVFSLAMSALCIYSSAVTHYGLQELCIKLGEITGSSTCTFTVNVATLTYERRIRGVYQATRLTILSAWLHTGCWLLSALLVLIRVLLAVDFQLVRINVQLHGDVDKILEKHEVQIRTVSPEVWIDKRNQPESNSKISGNDNTRIPEEVGDQTDDEMVLFDMESDLLYFSNREIEVSDLSIIPEERDRLARTDAYKSVPKDKPFIVKLLYELVDSISMPEPEKELYSTSMASLSDSESEILTVSRQFGQANVVTYNEMAKPPVSSNSAEQMEVRNALSSVDSLILRKYHKISRVTDSVDFREERSPKPSTSKTPDPEQSVFKRVLESAASSKVIAAIKPNLKTVSVQTEKPKSKRSLRVKITEKGITKRGSDSEASTSQRDDDQTSSTTEYDEQSYPGKKDQKRTSISWQDSDQASTSKRDDVQTSSTTEYDEQAYPSQKDQKRISVSWQDGDQASTSKRDDVQTSSTTEDDDQVYQNKKDQKRTSISWQDDVQPSTSKKYDEQTSKKDDYDLTSISKKDGDQISTTTKDDDQASLSKKDQRQTSISWRDDVQASTSKKYDEQAASKDDDEQTSMSTKDDEQKSMGKKDNEGSTPSKKGDIEKETQTRKEKQD